MTTPLALAIDIGSSAVRSAGIDAAGVVVASTRVARPDSSSGIEFDPILLWRQVRESIGALSADVRGAVAVVGIAGHVGTVFVDAALEPVVAGRGWADSAGVALLVEGLGDRLPAMLRETGRPVPTGGAGASFLELRHTQPAAADRVAHVLSPKDYVIARLTGEMATDRTSAAYTGLSAVASGDWSAEMLDVVGLDSSRMPPQHGSTDIVGTVAVSIADDLGLPPGTSVVAGGPDGTVGAAFVIGDRRDVVADIAGTTDVLVALLDRPSDAPEGALVNPYTLGGFAAGGPTGMTGGAFARWTQLLGFDDVASAVALIEQRAAGIGPGAAGLRIDPSVSGRRFPSWMPHHAGSVRGQRDDHRAEHFLLAVAEGAAFIVRQGVDRLDPEGRALVALAGGVTRSPVLARLRANVLGRPVLVCAEPDVSLLGAGLLAFRGSGLEEGSAYRRDYGSKMDPDPELAAVYQELFDRWEE